MAVPTVRIRPLNERLVAGGGDYVLYWMTAFRRPRMSFALDRAIDRATELKKPLLILEALRVDYPWASDRLHRFVIDGMEENERAFADQPVRYLTYVERKRGEGKGLLVTLATRACLVVTDDYPSFFLPRQARAAAQKVDVRMEAVDSNGLLPLAASEKVYTRAFDFRRFLQRALVPHLAERPKIYPFRGKDLPRLHRLPSGVTKRWRFGTKVDLSSLPIDHEVVPVEETGGFDTGLKRWRTFLRNRLDRYVEDRNHPDDEATSGLSPYLHFGHVSAHEVFRDLADREAWTPDQATEAGGRREGFWGMSRSAEAFLDQIVTWRELGFNMSSKRDDYTEYRSLPDWAKGTLAEHARDPRPHLYDLEAFEKAETQDEVWNAAQRELVETGRLHNYLRMLWGKKILEWSRSPEAALDVMVELNNKYAIDGRDPNSYSGIFWVLGRYDRAWGPERQIYGKVRYMSSVAAKRKIRMKGYLARFSGRPSSDGT